MKKLFISLVIILGIQPYSQAKLLIEPYVGYQSMTFDLKTGSSLASIPVKLEGAGNGYGVRIGYSGMLLFAAADIGAAVLDTKLKEGNVLVTPGTSGHSSVGATVGANFRILRPYVGYIMSDQFIGSSSGFTGSGYKAGLGFGFIPFVKINLEYYAATYNKYKTTASEVSLPDANSYESASMTGFMVNLSVPLTY